MNNFRMQQIRGSLITMMTAILLVVSTTFSIIGYAASDGTKQQLEAVESRYTTLGAMKDQNTQFLQHGGTGFVYREEGISRVDWIDKNYFKLDNGSILWDDGSVYYSGGALENVAKGSPYIRTVSRSAILSVHVKDIYGLTSSAQNHLQYNEMFDKYSYGMAVLVGTEENIDLLHVGAFIQTPNGERMLLEQAPWFHIDEIVSIHPEYEKRFRSDRTLASRTDFLSVVDDPEKDEISYGKQYIFRCFIGLQPVMQVPVVTGKTTTYIYKLASTVESIMDVRKYKHFDFTSRDLFELDGFVSQNGIGQKNFTLNLKTNYREINGYALDSYEYWYSLPEDSLPFYAEFTGTLEDFLNSEEGQVWRDVIIPMAEINQQSATVMLVDDLDYLHAFNSGKAIIVDGRKIDASEFVRGDKVCVVSSAYADYAGLEVGDTLNLDFYDTGYFLTSAKIENWDATVSEFVMTHNPLQENNRIGYQEDYTIVGIYSAPEYEYGTTSFYADTIFVPKSSVPDAEEYEDPSLPLLNSVVLMNGTTEEFEEYMESQGFGGYYTYFDQDYSSTIAGLQSLSQNALRLVILAGAVFFVTAILFYYLNFKRMIPVAYGMRRMGQHPFKLWWQMEMVTLPIILIAVFGGAYLGVYFFEYVTMELFETNIIMDIETVKWLTLLEAAALCAISLLVAIPISVPRLMKRK